MANLFLGFPVPRAKIATMIEEAAPPLNHISNHFPGGSDPIVASMSNGQILVWNTAQGKFVAQDAPSAGGDISFKDFHYYSTLPNLASLTNYNIGTATTEQLKYQVDLKTGTDASSRAELNKKVEYSNPDLVWTKKRKFATEINPYSYTSKYYQLYIGIGFWSSDGLFFWIDDGVLKCFAIAGSTQTTETIETLWTEAGEVVYLRLYCYFQPGVSAQFYVNDVLKKTITTNLPSAATGNEDIMDIRLTNEAYAENKRLSISHWKFWQEGV